MNLRDTLCTCSLEMGIATWISSRLASDSQTLAAFHSTVTYLVILHTSADAGMISHALLVFTAMSGSCAAVYTRTCCADNNATS